MARAKTLWGYIENRDHRVMRRINRWKAPRWIRFWMLAATRMGDGWIWYSLAGILLLGGGVNRYAAVGAAGSAALVGVFLFKALKRISHRQRPCHVEPHCWAKILPPDQFSFPSGHTITAFAVAVSLSRFYPDLAIRLLFCAASVAASRILLGMHFLSDVLAGAAIGTLLAYAVTFFLL